MERGCLPGCLAGILMPVLFIILSTFIIFRSVCITKQETAVHMKDRVVCEEKYQ